MTEVQRLAKIKVLKDMLKEYELLAKYNGGTDYDRWKALDMAIKTLEQENILDKIRAEMMDFEEELFHKPNTDYSDYSAVRYCVEIIDKYKAESEEHNADSN